MKICILHRYPISDVILTNPSMPYFLEELKSRGHETIYMSFRDKAMKKINGIKFSYIPFTFDRGKSFDKHLKSLIFILIAPYIAYRIRKLKPDAIYCDDSLLFYGYLIKKFTRLPVIIRLGDLQTGYLFLKKSRIHRLLFRLFHGFEVHSWKRLDGLIPISKPFERYLVSKGIKESKLSTVLESVDLKSFGNKSRDIRKEYGLNKDDIILMYHGVIEPLKGLDILINLITPILKNNSKLKLFIIGSGTSLPKLKALARKRSIENSIIWAGWVPFSEIKDYINSCDIGIPIRSDNFANNFVVTSALLQYWACSKAVITPKLESFKEIIQEGENGFMFDFNTRELSEKLENIIADKNLRLKLGRNGNSTMKKKFSASVIGKNLADAIEKCL
ncbi:MAG: glycosyltransferase family 4 protein [Candidatus Aenigmarchaeota archaeon]|nr:glycosyltransferase family 4 protein [Candidatus Aenigmarchaeota archaeon]